MRKIFLIPIVHSSSDMGSISQELIKERIGKFGKEEWEKSQKKISELWDRIELSIGNLGLNFSKVKIYQDGLPSVKPELVEKIASKAAESGSRNYKILEKFVDKGAQLVGTESPQALIREYKLIKEYLEAKPEEREKKKKKYEDQKDELLLERDKFIAARIDNTLKDGEIGLLFIGAIHKIQSKLPKNITTEKLYG